MASIKVMAYPVLLLRIKALMLDSVVFGILFFAMVLLAIEFNITDPTIKAWLILAPVILIEPVMIWVTGGSLGHHYAGIRVIGKNNGKNLFVLNGIVRFIVKASLGVFSLAAMLITRRHQSIHDLLSHSVVVFKNESLALPRHKMEARETVSSGEKPSIGRRFVVVIAYSAIAFLVYGTTARFLASGGRIESGICSEPDTLRIRLATLAFLVTIVAVVILGFLSKLPGACYRSTENP